MGVIRRGQKQIIQRYRPRKFSEVIGNESIKKNLIKWMQQGKQRSTNLLFVGQSGCGKTTISKILAMGLNCQKGDTVEPCLECDSCKQALAERALNIHDINIGSTGTKEDIDRLVQQMYQTSLTGRNNIWIMDESQMLTSSSQNLLLKPLENPPANTYMIFCTTESNKLIKTLQNRCEKYEFKLPSKKDISELLSGVCSQQMANLTSQQKQIFFDYVQGMSYREILNNFNQFVNGGIDSLSQISGEKKIDYWKLCQMVQKGDFNGFIQQINSNQNIDCEGFRRMMRTYLTKKLQMNGLTKKSVQYLQAFKIFDVGYFVDPNPLPSLKFMVFQACVIFSQKM